MKSALPSRTGRKKEPALRCANSPPPRPHASENGKSAAKAEVYWGERPPVDFYTFDDEYLRRLGARDPATEAHFVAYFSERLRITLRARGIDSHTIEDVRQETFCRVLVAVQAGNVNNAGGFGAYVYAVCKHVLSESRRDDARYDHESLEFTEVPDEQLGLGRTDAAPGRMANMSARFWPPFRKETAIFCRPVFLRIAITMKFVAISVLTATIFAF